MKHTVVPKEMFEATLIARPFDCEEDAIDAIIKKKFQPGDAVFIRYEGPKGSGMPEMFYTTEAIASDPELSASISIDHRWKIFRCIKRSCHWTCITRSTRRMDQYALVEDGDLIQNQCKRT